VIVMMFWYGGHWAFWQAGLMWAGMLIFWGLLIWVAWKLISDATRRPRSGDAGGDARHILDQAARDDHGREGQVMARR
jgi:hypothetical protein